jgi:hypothetical protein
VSSNKQKTVSKIPPAEKCYFFQSYLKFNRLPKNQEVIRPKKNKASRRVPSRPKVADVWFTISTPFMKFRPELNYNLRAGF